MLRTLTALCCALALAACTETGDSPYTYNDVPEVSVPDASGGVFWVHAEPLLVKACNGCHTGGSNGGNNFASVYEDNLKPSYYCAGQTVGECVLVRIDDNTMPPGGGANLTADERAVLDAWVEAGMPFDENVAPVADAAEDTGTQDTGPEDTGPEDTGPEDTGPEDTGAEDTGAEDTVEDTASPEDIVAPDAVSDAGPVVEGPTFTDDIQPILTGPGWCGGCHSGGSSGGSNFANTYADTQKPSYYCSGKTVGECILPRIDDNTMPPGGLTVSGADRALIESWIDAGMPE